MSFFPPVYFILFFNSKAGNLNGSNRGCGKWGVGVGGKGGMEWKGKIRSPLGRRVKRKGKLPPKTKQKACCHSLNPGSCAGMEGLSVTVNKPAQPAPDFCTGIQIKASEWRWKLLLTSSGFDALVCFKALAGFRRLLSSLALARNHLTSLSVVRSSKCLGSWGPGNTTCDMSSAFVAEFGCFKPQQHEEDDCSAVITPPELKGSTEELSALLNAAKPSQTNKLCRSYLWSARLGWT